MCWWVKLVHHGKTLILDEITHRNATEQSEAAAEDWKRSHLGSPLFSSTTRKSQFASHRNAKKAASTPSAKRFAKIRRRKTSPASPSPTPSAPETASSRATPPRPLPPPKGTLRERWSRRHRPRRRIWAARSRWLSSSASSSVAGPSGRAPPAAWLPRKLGVSPGRRGSSRRWLRTPPPSLRTTRRTGILASASDSPRRSAARAGGEPRQARVAASVPYALSRCRNLRGQYLKLKKRRGEPELNVTMLLRTRIRCVQ